MTTELLAPAGGQEALVAAVQSGADAVYMGFGAFNARRSARNFSDEEFRAAVSYCHLRGVKVYLTLNTLVTDRELPALAAEARTASECGVDAILVQDWGVLATLQKIIPDVPLHASTQMSLHTLSGVQEAARLGMTRAVLARELNREEIAEICQKSPIEIETFVHGALCMCYSGQCEMSAVIGRRSGNRGACAQPCRWEYTSASFSEVKRPDDVLTAEEFSDGTYIMSSRDTCMIEHIPELCRAGIDSLKIEGRMKSAYYTAVTANAYRMALDSYARDGEGYVYDPAWLAELESVSHREYATGFYFTPPGLDPNITRSPGYIREKAYLATALSDSAPDGTALFVQRNKAIRGERAEMISPGKCGRAFTMEEMYAENGEPIESAPHPSMIFRLKVPFAVKKGDILRGAQ